MKRKHILTVIVAIVLIVVVVVVIYALRQTSSLPEETSSVKEPDTSRQVIKKEPQSTGSAPRSSAQPIE